MSSQAQPPPVPGPVEDPDSYEAWQARSRLVLTPVAAPSILGLFGLAAATFTVSSNLAEWWGNPLTSPVVLAPFAIFLGGVAQLLAGMWAYRARDSLATAMHGIWGAFWLAWGLMTLLTASGALSPFLITSQAMGFWWIALGLITLFGAAGALAQNMGLFLTFILLTAGSGLLAAAQIGAFHSVRLAAGWVLVASSAAAFYTAGALLLEQSFGGRVILPLGRWSLSGNVPGHRVVHDIAYSAGMPGARTGQ
ncbi:acetate uptake transporter [Streptomyces spinosus]|uniref:acetate uptake transporter n=1 Tax=Streptomyces spinosus TaxID=2872623 RepID=UPI001CEDC7EA|nr:acetate uptake transporter [Streptomyces spinosus]